MREGMGGDGWGVEGRGWGNGGKERVWGGAGMGVDMGVGRRSRRRRRRGRRMRRRRRRRLGESNMGASWGGGWGSAQQWKRTLERKALSVMEEKRNLLSRDVDDLLVVVVRCMAGQRQNGLAHGLGLGFGNIGPEQRGDDNNCCRGCALPKWTLKKLQKNKEAQPRGGMAGQCPSSSATTCP